jgi:hypothetical protein
VPGGKHLAGTDACSRRGCSNRAKHYAMGAWVCDLHDPKGDPACTHSLGLDRCAWCGARNKSAETY